MRRKSTDSPFVQVLLLGVLLSAGVAAGQDLFTAVGTANPGGSPPPGTDAVFGVDIDQATLALAPETLNILLPNDGTIAVTRDTFTTFDGFDENHVPLPETTVSDLNFVWMGKGGGYDVVLTSYYGFTVGTFAGPNSYSLVKGDPIPASPFKSTSYSHTLRDNSAPPVPSHPPDTPLTEEELEALRAEAKAKFKPLPASEIPPPRILAKGHELLPEITIDILFLYSQNAMTEAAADAQDPGNSQHIESLAMQTANQINRALSNSQIDVGVRAVSIEKIPDFVESGDARADLLTLKDNDWIKGRRREIDPTNPAAGGADIVSVLVRNWSAMHGCGRSFVQREGCDDNPIETCGEGESFKEWAYYLIAWDCVRDYKTGIHEFGHAMSCEHQPSAAVYPNSLAARPHGFAYAFPPEGPAFQSAVYSGYDYTQTLNYSNPDVLYYDPGTMNSYTTGIPETRNNARALYEHAFAVSVFEEPRPDVVFKDGFEFGDTLGWSEVEGLATTP